MRIRLVTSLIGALLTCCASAATTIEIRGVATTYHRLSAPSTISVVAHDVTIAPTLLIRVDGADITSQVVSGSVTTESSDGNGDGLFETYSIDFTVDLSDLVGEETSVISFEGSASGANGSTVTSNRSAPLAANFELGSAGVTWVPEIHGTILPFVLRIQSAEILGKSYRVLLNGQDVTSQVATFEVVHWELVRNGVTLDRVSTVYVDTQGLPWVEGDQLTLEVILSYVKKLITTIKNLFSTQVKRENVDAETVLLARITPCVSAFVSAAQIEKNQGNSTTTVGNSDAVPAAAAALAECLKACGFSGEKQITLANGLSVRVGMPSALGAADVVIAVGAAGEGPGAPGGNASATNTQPGGAAVATGGAGGSGATPGGTGAATSNGGDAVGHGGAGGGAGSEAGGSGGSGSAENKNGNGTAKSKGGAGGNPGGANETGGSGGNATAKAGGASSSHTGGPGGTGTHGTGASASISGGNSTGSNGSAQSNHD